MTRMGVMITQKRWRYHELAKKDTSPFEAVASSFIYDRDLKLMGSFPVSFCWVSMSDKEASDV
jgi:hypothetical protein